MMRVWRHPSGLRVMETSMVLLRPGFPLVTLEVLDEPTEEQARTLGLTIITTGTKIFCCELGEIHDPGECPLHRMMPAVIYRTTVQPFEVSMEQLYESWELVDA